MPPPLGLPAALGQPPAQTEKGRSSPGKAETVFRSYGVEAGTFGSRAARTTSCEADREVRELWGQSQHQLGTTVHSSPPRSGEHQRGVLREGSSAPRDAGRWASREHATDDGFVMPYASTWTYRHLARQAVRRPAGNPININPPTAVSSASRTAGICYVGS